MSRINVRFKREQLDYYLLKRKNVNITNIDVLYIAIIKQAVYDFRFYASRHKDNSELWSAIKYLSNEFTYDSMDYIRHELKNEFLINYYDGSGISDKIFYAIKEW